MKYLFLILMLLVLSSCSQKYCCKKYKCNKTIVVEKAVCFIPSCPNPIVPMYDDFEDDFDINDRIAVLSVNLIKRPNPIVPMYDDFEDDFDINDRIAVLSVNLIKLEKYLNEFHNWRECINKSLNAQSDKKEVEDE